MKKEIYTLFVFIVLNASMIFSQNLNWLDNNAYTVLGTSLTNTKNQGEFSYVISNDVLDSGTSMGFLSITGFTVSGANANDSNFSGIMSVVLSPDENPVHGYRIQLTKGEEGSPFPTLSSKIRVYNPQGSIIGELEDFTISNTTVLRIEKTNFNTLVFYYDNTILTTVSDATDAYYRAALSSTVADLGMTYDHSGFSISASNTSRPDVIDMDMNWTLANTFNIRGELSSSSVSFFDCLGRGIQTQVKDILTGVNWAREVRYDRQGRTALSTLGAPINDHFNFSYKNAFITTFTSFPNELGNVHFEGLEIPGVVGEHEGTLGWYYSENNTNEPFQDFTRRPFTNRIYDELNPGRVRAVVGGTAADVNGNGQADNLLDAFPQGFSYKMPAAQELYYAFGKEYFPEHIANWMTTNGLNPNYSNNPTTHFISHRSTKTVVIDTHGNEAVIFSDLEGRTIATARSGGTNKYTVVSVIGKQGYVDVHLPKGTVYSDISFIGGSTAGYNVWDLRTGLEINPSSMTGGNIYRIVYAPQSLYDTVLDITSTGVIRHTGQAKGLRYKVNYYDYTLNYYNETGKLLESVQPLGFDDAAITEGLNIMPQHEMVSDYEYNSLGELLQTSNPDQGEAQFVYRDDGQIRFSQNIKQATDNEFSYTNYDNYARPIESGITTGVFPASNSIEITSGHEQTFTLYDLADQAGLDAALNQTGFTKFYRRQEWLAGNVSKTWTDNPQVSTTWYSYDVYGRVSWMVQQIAGLGTKIIDYTYDDISSEVKEIHYTGDAGENFKHRYTYNRAGQLITVETSNGGQAFEMQARYQYYETGGLKRTVLGNDLQGIDYVYNLGGALKAINHPSLTASHDPGGDANDVFGMIIDYNDNDYHRNGTNINNSPSGTNRYDGNIKAIRWGTDDGNGSIVQNAYVYNYDEHRWLEEATFGTATNSGSISLNPNGHYKVFDLDYDPNGNILSLSRNKNQGGALSNAMDRFTYAYAPGTNQLNHVSDAITFNTGADDLKDQDLNNYTYNDIGQLIENVGEGITYTYYASNLVKSVRVDNATAAYQVEFNYDERGHRVLKKVTQDGSTPETFYVRDAYGQVMAVYYRPNVPNSKIVSEIIEYPVYGISRLGIQKAGGMQFELTDHLGNVRAVIGESTTGTPYVIGKTDYYPFGMPMPNRNIEGGYRFAYQGQEKDPETGKEAFELRLWDSRIGRWLTTDPAGQFNSPYLGMSNNPVSNTDPDGGMSCPEGQTCGDGYNNPLDEVIVSTKRKGGGSYYISFQDRFSGTFDDWLDLTGNKFSKNRDLAEFQWSISYGDEFADYFHPSKQWRIDATGFALAFNQGFFQPGGTGVAEFWSNFAAITIGSSLGITTLVSVAGPLAAGTTKGAAVRAGVNLTQQSVSQLINTGELDLGKINIVDLGISTFVPTSTIGSDIFSSTVSLTTDDGLQFNFSEGAVLDFATGKLVSGIHSKIDGYAPDRKTVGSTVYVFGQVSKSLTSILGGAVKSRF